MPRIRQEQARDKKAIRALNLAAFGNGPEADLVDKLRATCDEYLSFVAVENKSVAGHILFTPVTIEGSALAGMGLAPMAVLPSRQGKGIGSLLVRHGMDYLRKHGCPFVVVLGHPEYYPRFGFEPASGYGISSQWEGIPDEAFMIAVFDSDALPEKGGVARYRKEFDEAV